MTIHIAKVDLKNVPPPHAFYIGRDFCGLPASALGNPYHELAHGRTEAINLYRVWLADAVQRRVPRIIRALEAIREEAKQHDVTLLCWCHPKPCHGEVVREAVETWEF